MLRLFPNHRNGRIGTVLAVDEGGILEEALPHVVERFYLLQSPGPRGAFRDTLVASQLLLRFVG